MKIPLTDLGAQDAEIGHLIREAAARVFASQQYILGGEVTTFEQAMAQRVGSAAAVGLSSCSDALFLALQAAGVGAGDEVITTSLSFVATAEAILRVGATPVFADVEPASLCIDPLAVRQLVNSKTRAILPVHLFGHPADMPALRAIAAEYHLFLLEDAAQALGASIRLREHRLERNADEQRERGVPPGEDQEIPIGAWGDAAAFSFFPGKVLGGAGDGGMLVADLALINKVKQLRVHGRDLAMGTFEQLGGNFRLDALQAAILAAKLPFLDSWVERRRSAALRYHELLAPLEGVLLPQEAIGMSSAWNYYVLQTPRAQELSQKMREDSIQTSVYYSTPLHRQPLFARLTLPQPLVHTEVAAQGLLALPLFPEITEEAQEYVASSLKRAFRK
ncbi:MAG: DegT/DnrJ/EryC1/StrS family aminotransferase [Polyangiaceae bacterium]|nr:DegT/DnrJ/EryC1/StrS family aminotransferase [Polyangiaceae bacterium]